MRIKEFEGACNEICPIPTVDEFNSNVFGEGFTANYISEEEFDEIWNTGIYRGSLTIT